ncbi:unnamed protein product, partial [Didymodactylos carnosus]
MNAIDKTFDTQSIHVGQDTDKWLEQSILPLINLYTLNCDENPIRIALETYLASLDNAQYTLKYLPSRRVTSSTMSENFQPLSSQQQGHGDEKQSFKFETNALHVGQEPEKWPGQAVVPPISMATTFKQISPGQAPIWEYSRCGNPTRQCLEDCLASVENAKYALTFSSGLGATTTLMFLLKSGDHILSIDDVYGGTGRLFRRCMAQMGVDSSFIDMTNADNISSQLRSNTKLVWLE